MSSAKVAAIARDVKVRCIRPASFRVDSIQISNTVVAGATCAIIGTSIAAIGAVRAGTWRGSPWSLAESARAFVLRNTWIRRCFMPKHSVLHAVAVAAALSACADHAFIPTESVWLHDRVGEIRPQFTAVTEADALQISNPYTARDLLSPYNVSYDEFFNNPEVISDEQFEAQVPDALYEWEIDKAESDVAKVYEYCSWAGGGDGPEESMTSVGGDGSAESMTSVHDDGFVLWGPSCEQKLEE
jgi:hypothetical protein